MLNFRNDYSEGAHPSILETMRINNLTPVIGYGTDEYCAHAADMIRERFNCPAAEVHFLVGGTQTNMTMIASALRPFEAVICAESGHINVHETGAIEGTGHKVLGVPKADGKLTPADILAVVRSHSDEHMVKPRMVYISQSTEVGTIYTRRELELLRTVCDEQHLLLYLDGARLASGMTAEDCDLMPADLPRLCDAFYIGGTKNGALFGEALVLVNDTLKPNFRYMIKNQGAMLAKGWLLGMQFEGLFTGDLYFTLGRHANAMAARLRDGLLAKGYELAYPATTNQIFAILSKDQIFDLTTEAAFEFSQKWDKTHDVVRFVTSWATKSEDVDAMLALL
ncbi:MAG: low specificity L-threonine aldolase [Butyricicoccus pullicaecorum]|nr:low specificity L-threonine aldolase [Butyricicoccus pullicaecorum]